MLTYLGLRVVLPVLAGFVLIYLVHFCSKWVAAILAGTNKEKFERYQKLYIETVYMMKDLVFIWAVGTIFLMMAGVIK